MEKLREIGFGLAAVGIGVSNFVIFVVIAIRGTAEVWEPNAFILGAELFASAGFIAWGLERLIVDWFKEKHNG